MWLRARGNAESTFSRTVVRRGIGSVAEGFGCRPHTRKGQVTTEKWGPPLSVTQTTGRAFNDRRV